MNRIRELRKARDWTAEDLGSRVGTSGVQITRLETGERRLTVDWMNRIAAALQVTPGELLATRTPLEPADDVGPPGLSYASLAAALSRRGLKLYSVLTGVVSDAGILAGSTITVDETPEAVARAAAGDLVVVEAQDHGGEPQKILRQFIPPRMLLINRPGVPVVMTLDDPSLSCRIVGVVIRD